MAVFTVNVVLQRALISFLVCFLNCKVDFFHLKYLQKYFAVSVSQIFFFLTHRVEFQGRWFSSKSVVLNPIAYTQSKVQGSISMGMCKFVLIIFPVHCYLVQGYPKGSVYAGITVCLLLKRTDLQSEMCWHLLTTDKQELFLVHPKIYTSRSLVFLQ